MRLLFLIYRIICMTCGGRRRSLFDLHIHPTLQFNGITFKWDGFRFVRESNNKGRKSA